MKPIILVGGGGHALSVCEMYKENQIIGYADLSPSDLMTIPYLGTDDEVICKYSPDEVLIHHTFVYANDVNLKFRQSLIEKYRAYATATLIADSALVTPKSKLGMGCAVMEKAVVNYSNVGDNCIINTAAVIEHGCQLGDNVFIGPGAIVCGQSRIGSRTFVGSGSIIRDDLIIGEDIVIGMGSRVTQNLLRPGLYFGNQFIKDL